ncbi:MAG: sugar transferase [Acidimicrobiia bacterium]|nr:sugar transferase [Acidimicrobiia bacterium]
MSPHLKRLFDISVSAVGLLLSSPLWLLVALAIKLDDGGPIFFSQTRVGLGGRPFTAWKFRSMVGGASSLPARQASAGDPRITRLGRLLRATALDELPQLWNILRGDMSVVGPRALAAGEIEAGGDGRFVALEDVPGYLERHAVRPGLTGLTQVYASRDLSRRNKIRLDLVYVRNPGLCLDLRLFVLSLWITLLGRWERRGRKV